MAEDFARGQQVPILTPFQTNAASRISQIIAMAATAPPQTDKTLLSQIPVLLAGAGDTEASVIPRTTQLIVMVAYARGSADKFNMRAWTFPFDGHKFYVLSLGKRGTWVYDFTTQQWAQWETDGYEGIWNMEGGLAWKGEVFAADNINPIIWRLNPHSGIDDDFRPMTRFVTGFVPHMERSYLSNYAFRVTASLGVPDDPDTAELKFSFSDDSGKTFSAERLIIITPDDFTQDLEFHSLGSIRKPGRVYKIEDVGALTRISGCNTDIENNEE
jgi:hypothetical protein